MPKGRIGSGLESRIQRIIDSAAHEIADAVRQNIADEVTRLVGGGRSRGDGAIDGRRKQKRHYPPHCVYPRCTKPHKGPRFSFLCEDHMNISKAAKNKLKKARVEA
jgi:hypothetical protein